MSFSEQKSVPPPQQHGQEQSLPTDLQVPSIFKSLVRKYVPGDTLEELKANVSDLNISEAQQEFSESVAPEKVALITQDFASGVLKMLERVDFSDNRVNDYVLPVIAGFFGLFGSICCFAGKRFSRALAVLAGCFLGICFGELFVNSKHVLLRYLCLAMPLIGFVLGWFLHEFAVLASLMAILFYFFEQVLAAIAAAVQAASGYRIFDKLATMHWSVSLLFQLLIVLGAFVVAALLNRAFRRHVQAAIAALIGGWMMGESLDFFGFFDSIASRLFAKESLNMADNADFTAKYIHFALMSRVILSGVFALTGFCVQSFAIRDQKDEDEEEC